MAEGPRALIAEISDAISWCERHLDALVVMMLSLPDEREVAEGDIASAREDLRRAREERSRVLRENLGSKEGIKAHRELQRASWRVMWAEDRLGSTELEDEHRRAVARQVAGWLREEAERMLDGVGSQDEGSELRRAVLEGRAEVGRAARHVVERFPAVRELQPEELRAVRAEALKVLDLIKNPPAG